MTVNLKFLTSFFLLLFFTNSLAAEHIVNLSQKIEFNTGDVIKLKGSDFRVDIVAKKGTECAVPGFNCGSGYTPPHPEFKIDCQKKEPCPFVILKESKNATSGTISIENEKSCETNQPENCFSAFALMARSDEVCQELKSPMGRYYCLKSFEKSARPENKGLCDKLPDSIYALKWNCFYEYAIRYNDPSFCDKYPPKDDGRDRCLLKMAQINHDVSICSKIALRQDNSYKEQCENLKVTNKKINQKN
jgi:hypothetical protein